MEEASSPTSGTLGKLLSSTETASESVENGTARTPLSRILLGKPRDPHDHRLFHQLSLIPFLAWVGLGADGLSSSAYGPEEAFVALGTHTYLALPLALLTAVTVVVISACYMRIIEVFPHGGGGYLVATKLLGQRAGLVAGAALLVDYILTITVSVAASGDAIFSLLPPDWQIPHKFPLSIGILDASFSVSWKLFAEVMAIGLLTLLNLRGVRESILVLVPIFMTFIITHIALILGGIVVHASDFGTESARLTQSFRNDLAPSALGLWGMVLLFLRAYSLGGGTYTGIEAVSNGLAVMRAPQVRSGKRTMVYMAVSLSFTAGGLIVCYLLAAVLPATGKTMNAILTTDILGKVFPSSPGLSNCLLYLTLASEGALLLIAAQAGFIGGPRVMANMAIDSFLPHRFSALSDRFTTSNGIVLMALTSMCALFYTGGYVRALVVMYSINVFVTFALAMFGMVRYWLANRGKDPAWRRRLALFTMGFVFCAVILAVIVFEKFLEGGWVTILVTGLLVAACLGVKGYYTRVGRKITQIGKDLEGVKEDGATAPAFDATKPTAALLVNAYSGLGMHTILKVLQVFPGYFKNFHFISCGTIDIGNFKGNEELTALEHRTEESLRKYVELANGLGFPARYSCAIGTDPTAELEKLCVETGRAYRTVVFFSGKILFEQDKWYHVLFHNQTAYALQKRLQWAGLMMVVLPMRIFEKTPALAQRR